MANEAFARLVWKAIETETVRWHMLRTSVTAIDSEAGEILATWSTLYHVWKFPFSQDAAILSSVPLARYLKQNKFHNVFGSDGQRSTFLSSDRLLTRRIPSLFVPCCFGVSIRSALYPVASFVASSDSVVIHPESCTTMDISPGHGSFVLNEGGIVFKGIPRRTLLISLFFCTLRLVTD